MFSPFLKPAALTIFLLLIVGLPSYALHVRRVRRRRRGS